jgi:hypothetical protein
VARADVVIRLRLAPRPAPTFVVVDEVHRHRPEGAAQMQPQSGLDGPSRTIIVEPAEQPEPMPERVEPDEAPAAPVPTREPVPA